MENLKNGVKYIPENKKDKELLKKAKVVGGFETWKQYFKRVNP